MDFADHQRPRPTLNIAPLIDVVFLLLVFFMLTSTFIEPQAIDLVLPGRAAPQTAPKAETLVVDVTAAGRIRLNGLNLTLEQLDGEIAGRLRDTTDGGVTVRAEAAVAVQLLVSVMDRVRAAGAANIKLATPEAR